MGENGQKVYGANQFATLVLTITALSGELPVAQVSRLPSTAAYREKVLKLLKTKRLIRTYYHNGLRGLRLTARAKKLLSAEQTDRFMSLFTGNTVTNAPKYTFVHRLRLHRMAEVLVTMLNAGVTVFPWEKPVIFSSTPLTAAPYIDRPIYYSSREVKNLGLMSNKIRGSRAAGVLLTDGSVFAVYNTGASETQWEYKAEIRLKALLEIELCRHRLPDQFSGVGQSAIVFGADMSCLPRLIGVEAVNRQSYFLSGESFPHFHYLTSDHYGEVVLRLVCDPGKKQALDSILAEDLSPPQPGLFMENDAMDENDPVLFGYTCDMPRIKRFDSALHIHDKKGTLYCFDFQEDALRGLCGPNVSIQVIDFEAYESNVFHADTDPTCGSTQEI